VVKLLLEKGAELEFRNNDGRTPLSGAAEKGHEAAVKLLLGKGAELESKDRELVRTPLSWGARTGHVKWGESEGKLLRADMNWVV
jgi:ankyrin repeat protein